MSKERAALVHGYLTDREGKDKPDRLTRVGILAAAELYRHGEIDKVCFTAKPELSDLQVKRLKTLLNNPTEKDIIVDPKVVTTRGEVETFKELSERNGWKNLITIANKDHLPRIRKEIKRAFGEKEIESISSRSVLDRYARYSPVLAEMDSWEEQVSLSFQEKILNTPIIGALALNIVPHFSKYKVALQYRFFNQLEK
jgi:hypothetical protein